MKIPYTSSIGYVLHVIMLSFLITVSAGCSLHGTLPQEGPELQPAGLPLYTVGTTFVYSDGTWEMVADASPGTVTWRNHRGHVSTGSPDFIQKRTYWETSKRKGERVIVRRDWPLLPDAESIWPLGKGAEYYYTEQGAWSMDGGRVRTYTYYGDAKVIGTRRVSVMAGEFDTWVIRVKRYASKKRLRETITWYYAPVVGHYVLMESKRSNPRVPSRRLELLAVIPPQGQMLPAFHEVAEKNLQQALEFSRSGVPVTWSDDVSGLSGKTTPTATFRLDTGMFCRSYEQELNLPGERKVYYGMACRDQSRGWIVPRK
ncbi:hypothetical protein N1030_00730 [Desulfovibrio mangrovi]|uniref:hypothetical protein n=1 Tax=Desulfovibrio mangrovi TaxID=2976983 RepID=UPI002246746D|nr:hypothetical protein [Desulfovibrio mangrovi]UZP67523.1 hypothetical protein N1030_00730 [Desulfovibrio mangrovi]